MKPRVSVNPEEERATTVNTRGLVAQPRGSVRGAYATFLCPRQTERNEDTSIADLIKAGAGGRKVKPPFIWLRRRTGSCR